METAVEARTRDGRYFVFQADGERGQDIWALRERHLWPWAGDRNEADATWSPDGSRLAFGYSLQGVFSPRWSPDGRRLAALSRDSLHLFMHDLASSKWREVVASLEGLRQPGATWGEWVGHAPDDSVLALRDTSIHELFAIEWPAP